MPPEAQQLHGHEAGAPARRAGQIALMLSGKALQLLFVIVACGLLVVYARLPHVRQQQLTEVSRVFLGIVLEALPFMLLGALVGGLVEVFVSAERIAAIVSRAGRRTVLLAAGMGVLLPVCECAVIPVVRRLVRKGAPLPAAVAYLLAGPIVNPIVFASTFVAYAGCEMPLVRAAVGYVVAVAVALLVGRVLRREQAFVPDALGEPANEGKDGHDHDHAHAPRRRAAFGSRLLEALAHAAGDFLDVGRFLVIGAFLAATLRTFVSQDAIETYGRSGTLSALPMMAAAFLLNLCSEADAFVAASFRGAVSLSGQLAFLVLGPMLDTKLLLMYLGVFRKRAIVILAVVIAVAVFAAVTVFSFLREVIELCILLVTSSQGF